MSSCLLRSWLKDTGETPVLKDADENYFEIMYVPWSPQGLRSSTA